MTLISWQMKPDTAMQNAFFHKRGPELEHNPLPVKNEKLRRQNQRLQEELLKGEIIIKCK